MTSTANAEIVTIDACGQTRICTILASHLNAASAGQLGTALMTEFADAPDTQFILDLQHVRTMDSACLGTFVAFWKWLARFDGKLVLANVGENIRFVFAVTRLDHVFPIYPTMPDALAAVIDQRSSLDDR